MHAAWMPRVHGMRPLVEAQLAAMVSREEVEPQPEP